MRRKERSDSHKFSSDLHVHSIVCIMHTDRQTHWTDRQIRKQLNTTAISLLQLMMDAVH